MNNAEEKAEPFDMLHGVSDAIDETYRKDETCGKQLKDSQAKRHKHSDVETYEYGRDGAHSVCDSVVHELLMRICCEESPASLRHTISQRYCYEWIEHTRYFYHS